MDHHLKFIGLSNATHKFFEQLPCRRGLLHFVTFNALLENCLGSLAQMNCLASFAASENSVNLDEHFAVSLELAIKLIKQLLRLISGFLALLHGLFFNKAF